MHAYREAIDGSLLLETVLRKNLYGTIKEGDVNTDKMAAFIKRNLKAANIDKIMRGDMEFINEF